MEPRIGIIGAGAIGCVVGGLLTKAKRDVTLIDQWPEHVEAMKRHGLRLSGTCGEHVIPVKALHLHEAQSLGDVSPSARPSAGATSRAIRASRPERAGPNTAPR
jgi:2-dehydropantoate 2-reductase